MAARWLCDAKDSPMGNNSPTADAGSSRDTPIERDVVVIGGGQAGLAVGWCLAQHGLNFVILDSRAEMAAAWRDRWNSLRLFTPARYSGLPGRPFPGDPD